jgi:uncharacterized protein
MKIERQLLNLKSARIKADDPGRFSGYASVFGGVDSYGDTIAPGAFADTLAERDRTVKMRWNHFGPVIGKWADGRGRLRPARRG